VSADVVVAGSGAAGLVAALTAAAGGARVTLLEKADTIGGTSAVSGGRLWVPANGRPGNEGDTIRAAREYLNGVFDERYGEMTDTFLAGAAPMTEFVERHTPHRFAVCPHYPDYHPAKPGATLGGRCLDMHPLDTRELHPRLAEVRRPPGYVPMTHAEWEAWRYPAYFDDDLLRHRRENRIETNGVALTSALLHGVLDAGVIVQTGATIEDVRRVSVDRRISGGLRITVDGETRDVGALILATGGFDWDSARRKEFLPSPVAGLGGPPSLTGDGLTIAESLGAATGNLGDGWWMPMMAVPGETIDGERFCRGLVRERGAPKQVVVNEAGRRFVDEALPYNEIGKAMHRRDADGGYPNGIAYLVFDAGFHRRYPLPGILPGQPVPDWVPAADSPRALASRIGVDPDGLQATLDNWNAMCPHGVDEEFGRGGNPYDRYYGDARVTPNPTMAPIDEGPYYAVRMLSGSAGTKGGPVTDVDARVLDRDGEPVPGLYAAGNTTAFWTADGYPGPGSTLAIGMTFGHRAARAALESG
jgi:3-oxosteroid 1-dehydrogenase